MKWKKTTRNIANFEAFGWNTSLRANLLISDEWSTDCYITSYFLK